MDSKKLITSIIGLVTAILAILGAVNIIKNDLATELSKWVPVLINSIASIIMFLTNSKDLNIKNIL